MIYKADVVAIEEALYKILFILTKDGKLDEGMKELTNLKTRLKLHYLGMEDKE